MGQVDVVVRLADRDSASALAAVHRAAAFAAYADIFPPDAPPPTWEEDLARWQHWLGPDWDRGRRAHVAVAGGRVVGVVLSGPDPEEPGVGHLARLYVDPSRWGRGVGTRLYAAAHDQLVGRGDLEATLWVLEANDRARRWYERWLAPRDEGEHRRRVAEWFARAALLGDVLEIAADTRRVSGLIAPHTSRLVPLDSSPPSLALAGERR